MLDSVEKDNKTISQMYKGNELVWEMPQVMTNNFDLYAGMSTISLTSYPSDCDVKIEINGKITAERKTSSLGSLACGLRSPLKIDDRIVITISKPGWRKLIESYHIEY